MSFHDYVTRRLEEFRDTTPMWGSDEAVELTAIQLLEAEVVCYLESLMEANSRVVFDVYLEELKNKMGSATKPLYQVSTQFGADLFDVCKAVRHRFFASDVS